MILDNTPVLVGVGQCVQRDPGTRDALPSPMDLLERAARAALADTAAGDLEHRFKALPTVAQAALDCREATVESQVLILRKGQPEVAYVAARADDTRLLAKPAADDPSILPSFTEREPVGRRITVRHDGQCHRFRCAG